MNKTHVQYLHHGILAITALLYSWATIYGKTNAFLYSALIGFGTYFIYRLAYYQPIFDLRYFKFRLKIKPSKFDLILLLIVSITTISNITFSNILLLSTLGFISGLYFLIIQHPKLMSYGIRKLPFIKNVFLSAMWTIGTMLLPLFFVGNLNFLDTTMISRFVYILIICIAIDLRDINADEKAKTITLPTWIGFKNTKLICFILLTVYFALIMQLNVFDHSCRIQNTIELVYYGTGTVLGLSLTYLKPNLERRIYTIILDGCLILQAGGLFIFSTLNIG